MATAGQDEEVVTITLKPGTLGCNFGITGIVTEVNKGSLAQQSGIKEGMQFVTVDGDPFSPSWLRQRIRRAHLDQKEYTVTMTSHACKAMKDVRGAVSSEKEEGILDVSMTPGKVGLTFIASGIIKKVFDESQAQKAGIKRGMQLAAVDGQPFTTSLIQDKIRGTSDFIVTLRMSGIEVTLKPGTVGLNYKTSGVITEVFAGSQAQGKGLMKGMQIMSIDGVSFTPSLIEEKAKGDSAYKIIYNLPLCEDDPRSPKSSEGSAAAEDLDAIELQF